MSAWLSQNWGNIVILSVIALAVGSVIFFRIRARRRGESGCSCGCGGCAMQGICHGQKEDKKS